MAAQMDVLAIIILFYDNNSARSMFYTVFSTLPAVIELNSEAYLSLNMTDGSLEHILHMIICTY